MFRHFIIIFLVFVFCSPIYADMWTEFPGSDIYHVRIKTQCAPQYNYRDNDYDDCTTDGDNGDYPWCSSTLPYQGLIGPCINFQRPSNLSCLPSFTMPGGQVFTKCDYLSSVALYRQCKTNNTNYKYRYCTDALDNPTDAPTIARLDICNSSYESLAVDHTMCYKPSVFAFTVPLTPAEQQEMLDLHNSYRAAVVSRYMFVLYWDDELAAVAQAHADLCNFEHDLATNRETLTYKIPHGQNIVMTNDLYSTPAELFDVMYFAEKDRFTHGEGCYPEGSCLHYTQAMLSNITRMGCGQSHCVYPDRIDRHITCNYLQSQYEDNYQTPYEISETKSAIDCPSHEKNGICDCGGVTCRSDLGENVHPRTCKCVGSGTKSVKKRDANEYYIDSHINSIDSKLVTKRDVNTIPLNKHLVKRSSKHEHNDVNQKHIDLETGKEPAVMTRPGTMLLKSRAKRHVHTIPIKKRPAKRSIKNHDVHPMKIDRKTGADPVVMTRAGSKPGKKHHPGN